MSKREVNQMTKKIYEFNPVIYPFRLWVGINVPVKDIIEKFYVYNIDDNTISDITDEELFRDDDVVATTYPMVDRVDDRIGAFININKKDKLTVGVIAHESIHVCDFLSDRLGLVGDIKNMYSYGEARGYFVEWVANCINSVKLNKFD